MNRLLAIGALLIAASTGLARAQPARIVSTSPSVTETLFALGAGSRVVGVTQYCHYPPEVAKIPKIGTWAEPNTEIIISMRPGLVIIQRTAVQSGAILAGRGVKVLEVRYDTIADILQSIRSIGTAVHAEPQAATLVQLIRDQLDAIHKRVAGIPPTSLMFIVGRTPGVLESMVAVGKGSYLDEVMRIAGGRNIFADSLVAYLKVTHEDIVSRSPEVIVDMGDMSDPSVVTEDQKKRAVVLWRQLPSLRAVKTGRVYAVSSDIFVVPGPRVVDVAREFAKLLHPESLPEPQR